MGTIKEVENKAEESEKLYDALRELGFLPRGYGYLVRVRGESRKKRQSASFENSWSPDRDSIQITFVAQPGQPQQASQPAVRAASSAVTDPKPKSGSLSDPVSDLIKALDRAECQPGYNFVALKWFRDTNLPSEGFAWANAASVRDALRDCIDKRLILTSKVPNPRSPEFPVTAIRLNRLKPEVRAILGTEDAAMPDFQPVPIRGESLSATVLRERR
jgi:hypothetical protein